MYSLLIVDDETIILEGIKEVIQTADLPLSEVKTAASAMEAIELFQKTPFDIIIADINMPQMDGLSMIQKMREIWSGTAVIILTGFQNFQYAIKALQLGSLDYLIKPVTDEQLIQSLKTIITNLDKEWFRRVYEKRLFDNIEMELVKEQRNFFIHALKQGIQADPITQERLKELKVPINIRNRIHVIVIRYNKVAAEVSEQSEYEIHYWLLNILKNVFYGRECVYGFQYSINNSIFLLQSMAGQMMDEMAFFKEIEEMQSYFVEKVDTILSIGMLYNIKWEEWYKGVQEVLYRQEEARSFGQLFLLENDLFCEDKLQEPSEEQETVNYFVRRICEYTKKHLEEDLSLSSLSNLFHINPSYLSRLFHKETGIQLSQYIAEARIDKAVALLNTTDDKIYEIAEKVGFETAGYFTKVFCKAIGMTPKEFRLQKLEEL